MSGRWEKWELDYLHQHASDGAEAIAERIGRTIKAVQIMGQREGVSLVKFYICPNCGRKTFTELTRIYGWCRICTIEEQTRRAIKANEEIRREIEREEQAINNAEKERQNAYREKNRLKTKICTFCESRGNDETKPTNI